MSEQLDLDLGILDHLVMDGEGFRSGRVDDLELTGIREGNPKVEAMLVGRRKPVRVPWEEVAKVDSAVWLKRPASELRLRRGDERMRRFIEWIPGSHR
jgi:sporulation protein YlmC with PRC-barrel domain